MLHGLLNPVPPATSPDHKPDTPGGGSPRVSLVEITPEIEDAVRALRVAPGQEHFVSSVAHSFVEAAQAPEGKPWPRAVLLDDEPVGFLMMSWDVEPAPGLHGPYFLWKLLVDERRQRQGIGRAALAIVCQEVLDDGGRELLTSCVPGEGSPQPFYEGLGFVPTGEVDEGEVVLRLDLSRFGTGATPTP